MKKLSIVLVIMFASCHSVQDTAVTDKTQLPAIVVNTLQDTTVKYNQTTLVVDEKLYVIENKKVIRKVDTGDDDGTMFWLGILVGGLLVCLIGALITQD